MVSRAPVGGRGLDVEVEDYRGLAAAFAGLRWGEDHPLPSIGGTGRRLSEQVVLAMGMYEAGIAAALLYGPDVQHLEAFWKRYLRTLAVPFGAERD